MKTNKIMAVVAAGLLAITFAGEAMARGGNGRGGGQGSMSGTGTQTRTGTPANTSMTRPADSQRRDGTFLSTGMTANGSTTRPTNGNGLHDGSGMIAVPAQ